MAASSASHSSLNMRPTGVSSKKRSGWSVVSRSMSPPCRLRLCVGRPPLHEGAGGLGDVAGREAVLLQQIVVRGRLAVDVGDADPLHGRGAVVAEHFGEIRPTPMKRVGVADVYSESAANDDLLQKYGLTAGHIAQAARSLMERRAAHAQP